MTTTPTPAGRSRLWIGVLIGAAAVLVLLALLAAGLFFFGRCPMCGRGMDGMMGDDGGGMMGGEGMMEGGMPRWMMSEGMGPGMRRDMRVIHTLLTNHEAIERQVEDIPGGVRATTTSDDPEIAQAICTHVHQMKERLEKRQPIRMMDPVFRELFRHAGEIRMSIEEIEGGVRVTETSDAPKVQALIRQHAHRAVSEFVEQGMARAMRPTSLPEGY